MTAVDSTGYKKGTNVITKQKRNRPAHAAYGMYGKMGFPNFRNCPQVSPSIIIMLNYTFAVVSRAS
jgi:hypothetical protein